MSSKEKFKTLIDKGYTFKKDSIVIGGAMLDGKTLPNTFIKIPLKTLNRHGLIAGATGTGKTKSLQGFAEGLSDHGIPVLLMDIKGDLSGLAQASGGHPKIDERSELIGHPWSAQNYPVEFLTISKEKGIKMRATVSEFGPVLISKILDLNDTQSGIISLVFKYCDDNRLPLLDLKDLKKTIQFISNEGKKEIEKEYGRISSASTGTILRKIIELEQQGAALFFGEKSFEVDDLLRQNKKGQGMINIFRLMDIQGKPKLFSTFMLCLMAEIYSTLPESGDSDKPKLVIFIDEAHLIFDEASDALMDQLETMVKLIRSKGVGLYFCTQNPQDIPEEILSQLGLKIQHALRAFTARDRKKIKLAAENFPLTDYYEVDEILTQMGIGEALVTALNEKGIPTPLAATLMCAPRSRMDVLTGKEINTVVNNSKLTVKYNQKVNRKSAYELLSEKIEILNEAEIQNEREQSYDERGGVRYHGSSNGVRYHGRSKPTRRKPKRSSTRRKKSTTEKILNSSVGRTIAKELTRGLLGVFGLGGSARKRKNSWF